MSKMPKKSRAICIDIMEKLMKLPCAKIFLDPVDPANDKIPENYFQVIKHPIDLNTINRRLINGEYPAVSQWDKDMNFIWNNAEKIYQKTSYIAILANELRIHYEKEYNRIKILRLPKWTKAVFVTKKRIEELFNKIPPFIGAIGQSQANNTDKLKPFSEEELNIFIRMSSYLNNSCDSRKMAQLVQHFQPETEINSTPFEIDVNDLKNPTLYALRDYATLRLGEMNLEYPR